MVYSLSHTLHFSPADGSRFPQWGPFFMRAWETAEPAARLCMYTLATSSAERSVQPAGQAAKAPRPGICCDRPRQTALTFLSVEAELAPYSQLRAGTAKPPSGAGPTDPCLSQP